MSRRSIPLFARAMLGVLVVVLLAAACGDDDVTDAGAGPDSTQPDSTPPDSTQPDSTQPDSTQPDDTQADDAVPGDGCDTSTWVTVDIGEFSFLIPSDLVDQEAMGIDSLVGSYSREGMSVGFDYGWYSPDFDELVAAGASALPVTVGAHDGTLVSVDLRTVPDRDGNHFLGLHVPVEVTEGATTALAMWINYDDEADTAEATCITETVTFA